MNALEREALIAAACEARQQAYCPYSKFPVGAALRATSGQVFSGCNVENASFGVSNCAERTALFSAIAAGVREFTALAVATAGGYSPCGVCRQAFAEFCPDLPILLVDSDDPSKITETTLADLLPARFDFPSQ